jgi:GTPase Era involved in 16S rRNA processing
VSSLTGEGIDAIRNYLFDHAHNSPWDFPENIYSDDDPRDVVTRIVKSKFLDVLPTDVPYKLRPVINTWIVENGVLRIGIEVTVDRYELGPRQ